MSKACASCSSSVRQDKGKSVHANQMLALEQKYGGFTFIFDIGGSYESLVELYGGKVDRYGAERATRQSVCAAGDGKQFEVPALLRQAVAREQWRSRSARKMTT